MLNEKLRNLLDELAIKFAENADAEIVRSKLWLERLISKSENETLLSKILSDDIFKIMFNFLKPKDENKVFRVLQQICVANGWRDLFKDIEQGIDDEILEQSTWTSVSANDKDQNRSLKSVQDNLVIYLRQNVETIFKYWDKLGASKADKWKNFYNSNIIIRENSGKIFSEITNIEQLFENQDFNRIVITAPAGYGKSTFVHEMVRQWVTGSKSKFKFVFLLRLGEIKCKTGKFSLKDLFENCLMEKDAEFLLSVLNQKLCLEILFIFDGFDEMNENLVSDEVMDIILGKSVMQPFVIVTSRPEKCVDKIRGECNVYLELKGFSEKGSNEQLKKFKSAHLFNNIDKDILKVPLFCTLVCILQQNSKVCIEHHFQLMEQTLDYVINRYKILHTDFSDDDKKELFSQLGRYALPYLVRRDPLSCVNFDESQITKKIINQKIVNIAISVNLIMPTSSENEIYFPHRMFAEYFAAFYFKEKNSSINCQIDELWDSYVCVNKLRIIIVDSWFIYFLSHFNEKFKLELWNLIATCKKSNQVTIPMFDEYATLPYLNIAVKRLWFGNMPTNLVSRAARKLNVPSEIFLKGLTLDAGFEFKNKSDIREVEFLICDIIASAAELLKSFNRVTSMSFRSCDILGSNNSGEINLVDHISATDNATFYPPLFDLSESLRTIYIYGQIGDFNWIKDLKRSDIHAYLWLMKSKVKNHFSDLRKLETFFQDYKDQSELCHLYLTRDEEKLPLWLRQK